MHVSYQSSSSISVADPDPFDADPASHFYTDPDPGPPFLCDTDPGPDPYHFKEVM